MEASRAEIVTWCVHVNRWEDRSGEMVLGPRENAPLHGVPFRSRKSLVDQLFQRQISQPILVIPGGYRFDQPESIKSQIGFRSVTVINSSS